MSSNPYDLTSGVIALANIRNDQRKLDMLKPMYEAEAQKSRDTSAYYRERTRTDKLSNDITQSVLEMPELARFFNRNGIKKNTEGGWSYDGLNGDYKYGFKPDFDQDTGAAPYRGIKLNAMSDSQPSQSYTPSSSFGIKPPNYSIAPRASFVDGTQGGLRVNNGAATVGGEPVDSSSTAVTSSADSSASAGPARSVSNTGASSDSSGISMLAQRDPEKADTVVRNVFNMSNREFQKLSGGLALVDFARGKITSDQMLKHVQNLEQMQKEGVMAAAQQVLAGNFDKAKKLFSEYGDENSDNIATFEPIKVKNPIAGAAKGTKDEYDAFKIVYKDGTKMMFDPRRYAMEIIGVKASMDHDEKIAQNIRTTDASNRHSDVLAEGNAENRRLRQDQNMQQQQGLAAGRYNQSFNALRDDMLKTLSQTTGQSDMLTNPDKFRQASAEVMAETGGGQDLALLNVQLAPFGGALNASPQALVNYAKASKDPAFFNAGNRALRTDSRGNYVGIEKDGMRFVQTIDGVFIPVPARPQNSQRP